MLRRLITYRASFVLAIFITTIPSLAAPLAPIPKGDIAIRLKTIADGLGAPDYGIAPDGDTDRLFVIEQNGLLLVLENDQLLPTPALDMRSRVSPPFNPASANDERGFLGLAFHPGFSSSSSPGFQTLYTYSTEPLNSPTYPAPMGATQNFQMVVNEWKMSASDPNVIDPASRRAVFSLGKNANNHNGGTLAFGPDGYMYLAIGDGGNANDVGASHIEPGGNAQNLSTPNGKMLRFDPILPSLTTGSPDAISANGQYRIPADNPFQGVGQAPEIYAYGLRNPYRFAFDTLTDELILADVGQNNIEEINRIEKGGNYGWPIKEGTFIFNRTNQGPGQGPGTIGANSPGAPAGLIDPISGTLGMLQYDHADGISITGGFVYRGTGIPELFGKYVFGDLALRNAPPRVDGRLFYADLVTGEIEEFLLPQFIDDKLPNGLTVHGFGQDGHGELYAMVTNTPANGTGGIVYKLVAIPEPATLSSIVAVAGLIALVRIRR
jgi:glucose/arabinose dehydrogenase